MTKWSKSTELLEIGIMKRFGHFYISKKAPKKKVISITSMIAMFYDRIMNIVLS